jgi:monoamine oxidase
LPEGGYSKVIGNIFSQCRASLRLGEKVLKIDYSGEMVRVVTQKDTYRCRYVIGSFPLGVLQNKKVEFNP